MYRICVLLICETVYDFVNKGHSFIIFHNTEIMSRGKRCWKLCGWHKTVHQCKLYKRLEKDSWCGDLVHHLVFRKQHDISQNRSIYFLGYKGGNASQLHNQKSRDCKELYWTQLKVPPRPYT